MFQNNTEKVNGHIICCCMLIKIECVDNKVFSVVVLVFNITPSAKMDINLKLEKPNIHVLADYGSLFVSKVKVK